MEPWPGLGEEPFRLWCTAKRPPAPADARRWLERHAGAGAEPPPPTASQQVATHVSALTRLLAAPHQPPASKWGAFAPPAARPPLPPPPPHQQQQQSSGSSAPVPGKPSWGSAAPAESVPAPPPALQRQPAGADGLQGRSGRGQSGGSHWGGRAGPAPVGTSAWPAEPAQQPFEWRPEPATASLQADMARAGSNSPPAAPHARQSPAAGKQPIVYPPDAGLFTRPGGQRQAWAPPPQQQQQQWAAPPPLQHQHAQRQGGAPPPPHAPLEPQGWAHQAQQQTQQAQQQAQQAFHSSGGFLPDAQLAPPPAHQQPTQQPWQERQQAAQEPWDAPPQRQLPQPNRWQGWQAAPPPAQHQPDHSCQEQQQQQQQHIAPAPAAATQPPPGGSAPAQPTLGQRLKLRQAVLTAGGTYEAPPADPPAPASAWQRRPSALQELNGAGGGSGGEKAPAARKAANPGRDKEGQRRGGTQARPASGGQLAAAALGADQLEEAGKQKAAAAAAGRKGKPKPKAAAVPGSNGGAEAAAEAAAGAVQHGTAGKIKAAGKKARAAAVPSGAAAHAAAATAAGQQGGPDSDAGGAAPAQKPSKRQRRAAPADGAAAAEPPTAAEVLELGPWCGSASVANELGFARFSKETAKAASCSVGVLLADPTGRQFFSTLQPLTKEQAKAIKAAEAAAAGGGGKKARTSGKGKGKGAAGAAAAAAVAASGGNSGVPPAVGAAAEPAAAAQPTCGGEAQVVGLCVQPIHVSAATGEGRPGQVLYFVPLVAGVWGGLEVSHAEAEQGRGLAGQLLAQPSGAVLAFNVQGVLRLLSSVGVALPPPHLLQGVLDPRLLAWLLEPQLLYGSERELQDYSLAELAARHLGGMPPSAASSGAGSGGAAGAAAAAWAAVGAAGAAGGGAAAPLARMRQALEAAMRLGEALHARLVEVALPAESMEREMQVAALLAQMEATGLGFNPWLLSDAGAAARAAMSRMEQEAAALAGRPFNLASPQQLAEVLYTVLKLPRPAGGGRGAAKTHTPTDENALKSLQQHSRLPGLVLQYRELQNFVSKFVDAEWVRVAAAGQPSAEAWLAAHPGCRAPRISCSWNQTQTATGRLSSSAPNLQAVTKYSVEALGPQQQAVSIRDAFQAPPGCTLVAVDYSQVELRLLAHLSGDPALCRLLQQSQQGQGGDAFQHIASTWLRAGEPASVSKENREKAKRVTYALIYGSTAWGLAQGLGIAVAAAQELIDSFLATFQGAARWIEATKAGARATGGVCTLAGRRRPLPGLASADKKVRAEAERRAVNTSVQGSAADLMKAAMLSWCRWYEEAGRPAIRMVAQIHDELLLEVEEDSVNAAWAAQELARVMEGVGAGLRVPLACSAKVGRTWGSMHEVE